MPSFHSATVFWSPATGDITCTLATTGSSCSPGTCTRAAGMKALRWPGADNGVIGYLLQMPIPPGPAPGRSSEYGKASSIPCCLKRSTASGVSSATAMTSALSSARPTNCGPSASPYLRFDDSTRTSVNLPS